MAWSWDFHRLPNPSYARYTDAFGAGEPSIFGRRAGPEGAGDLLFLGHAGIDGPPELIRTSDGRLWCAWPSLSLRGTGKSFVTSVLAPGAADRANQAVVEEGVRDVCTPRLFERGSSLHAVWSSQDREGRWSLKLARLREGTWTEPTILEAEGSPRFPSVAVDGEGRPWVAFVREGAGGRRISVRALGP